MFQMGPKRRKYLLNVVNNRYISQEKYAKNRLAARSFAFRNQSIIYSRCIRLINEPNMIIGSVPLWQNKIFGYPNTMQLDTNGALKKSTSDRV